jgi:phenylacetic acid degradation protein paaN
MNLYLTDERRAALWRKHESRLKEALEAWHRRTYWAAYPEDPKSYPHAEEGLADFRAQLRHPFNRLRQEGDEWLIANEVSPYTQEPLGIAYPKTSVAEYIRRAQEALSIWRWVPWTERLGLLVESVERMTARFHEMAHATMHTTGQGWMMAFQASGPHAADRAIEALAVAYQEFSHIPEQADWVRDLGRSQVHVRKYFIPQPEGLSLHIGVSTFPVWNTLPGLYASLAVGSPVILKPHPRAIYPIAIVIAILQEVFEEYGLPPTIVQLAPDTIDKPITKALAEHPLIRIIDYTGSTAFGEYLESLPHKITFLEKAGVNPILIESVEDMEAVAKNIAFSASLYSGQMCTAPQNVYIPREGVRQKDQVLSYEEVRAALEKAIQDLVSHPKAAPAILGALQNDAVGERIGALAQAPGVRKAPAPYTHPEFQQARTLTHVLIELSSAQDPLAREEHFGPRLLFIPVASAREGLEAIYQLAKEKGMLSCAIYTTDEKFKQESARLLAEAAVPVSYNYRGNVFINQSAAFSDFHGSGGNPASNASFTDAAFIVKRFRWVELRDCLSG